MIDFTKSASTEAVGQQLNDGLDDSQCFANMDQVFLLVFQCFI